MVRTKCGTSEVLLAPEASLHGLLPVESDVAEETRAGPVQILTSVQTRAMYCAKEMCGAATRSKSCGLGNLSQRR